MWDAGHGMKFRVSYIQALGAFLPGLLRCLY